MKKYVSLMESKQLISIPLCSQFDNISDTWVTSNFSISLSHTLLQSLFCLSLGLLKLFINLYHLWLHHNSRMISTHTTSTNVTVIMIVGVHFLIVNINLHPTLVNSSLVHLLHTWLELIDHALHITLRVTWVGLVYVINWNAIVVKRNCGVLLSNCWALLAHWTLTLINISTLVLWGSQLLSILFFHFLLDNIV